jgi:hypothetical protein
MQWRELPGRAWPYVAKVGIALTAFILLYEAYAHVASVMTMREYELASYDVRLDSEQRLSTFAAASGGGLTHEIAGGTLRVHGTSTAAAGPAFVRFAGPVQRLDDVVATHLRFRTRTPGAYDVFVGLELADGEPNAPGARRVVAVMKNGASPAFAIEGDVKSMGARQIANASSPVVPFGNDAGADDAGSADGGALDAGPAPEQSHGLALSHATHIHELSASFDGLPVAAAASQWWMGTRVRMIFGVVAREAGVAVDVALEDAAFEQLPRPTTLAPFQERFNGRLLDPRRWTVIVPDGAKGETSYEVDPKRGLAVRARSLGLADFQPGFVLLTPPTALASFSLKTRLDVEALKGSGFVIGIVGSGYSPARSFDFGFKGAEDGTISVLAAGHWRGDGQFGMVVSEPWQKHEATVSVAYDAASGKVSASIDGRRIAEYKLDLLPGDTVQLRVAANLQAADAKLDLLIKEIVFERSLLSTP